MNKERDLLLELKGRFGDKYSSTATNSVLVTVLLYSFILGLFFFVGTLIFLSLALHYPWMLVNTNINVYQGGNYTEPIGNVSCQVQYFLNHYTINENSKQLAYCEYGKSNSNINVTSIPCEVNLENDEFPSNSSLIYLSGTDANKYGTLVRSFLITNIAAFSLWLLGLMIRTCRQSKVDSTMNIFMFICFGLGLSAIVTFNRNLIPSLGIDTQLNIPIYNSIKGHSYYFMLVSVISQGILWFPWYILCCCCLSDKKSSYSPI